MAKVLVTRYRGKEMAYDAVPPLAIEFLTEYESQHAVNDADTPYIDRHPVAFKCPDCQGRAHVPAVGGAPFVCADCGSYFTLEPADQTWRIHRFRFEVERS